MKKTIFKKLLKWAGYSLFFLLSLLFFFVMTFPFKVFESKISGLVKEGTGADVKIEKISSYWITGIRFSGVRIMTGGEAGGEGEEGAAAAGGIRLDEVKARVSILPLIFGKTVVEFKAQGFGGRLSGKVEKTSKAIKVEAGMEGLQVAQLVALKSGLDVTATGGINCEISLALSEKSVRSASGQVTLSAEKLVIEKGKVEEYELPKLAIGDLTGRIVIDKGRASLQDFKTKSEDAEGTMDGYILLNQNLPLSTARIQVKVRPTQEYLKTNKLIGTLLGFLNKARTRDGFYGFTIYGPIKSLSARQG